MDSFFLILLELIKKIQFSRIKKDLLFQLTDKIKNSKITIQPIYHFSRESKVKEYGKEIWGAKKHKIGMKRLLEEKSFEEIEVKGEDYAIEKITKKNLIPEFDVDEQIINGKSAGHIYYSKQILNAIPTKPQETVEYYRKEYYNEISFILSVIEETYSIEDLFFKMRKGFRITEQELNDYIKDIKEENKADKKRIYIKSHRFSHFLHLTDIMSKKYANLLSLGDFISLKKEDTVEPKIEQAMRLENGDESKIIINPSFYAIDIRDKTIKENGYITVKKSTKQDYENLKQILNPKKIITEELTISDSFKEHQRKLLKQYGNLEELRFPFLSESGEIAVKHLGQDFDFKGIQFGNYVSDQDRIIHTKLIYGAFYDLAKILNMELKNISLDHRLSISIGARGSGRAKAHYEPLHEIINLTKSRGNGSIAHEYGHSLDFIFYKALLIDEKDFTKSMSNEFYRSNISYKKYISSDLPKEKRKRIIENISDEDVIYYLNSQNKFKNFSEKVSSKVLESFYKILAYIRESHFRARILNRKGGEYWGKIEELFARAFESYIYDKMISLEIENHYLVFSTMGEIQIPIFSIYPQKEERQELNKLFDSFFEVMKPNWNNLFK